LGLGTGYAAKTPSETSSSRTRRLRHNGAAKQHESPEAFDSGDSLCSSLTTFASVLASSAFAERRAPFSPARFV